MKVTLYERSSGHWRLRIETRDDFGRRLFKYETLRGDRSVAEARKGEIERGAAIKAVKAQVETLADFVPVWIADKHAMGFISESSTRTYTNHMKPFLKLLGHKRLNEVSRNDIEAAYRTLARTKGAQWTIMIHVNLRGLFREALTRGLIAANPMDGVQPPKSKKSSAKITTLTKDQMSRLREESCRWGTVGEVVRFALGTGARRGEICGLRWGDIDFATGKAHIRRQFIVIDDQPRLSGLKTASSNRVITLPASLVTELQQRAGQADEYVFQDKGRHWHPNTLTQRVTYRMKAVGLGEFTLHDLRHAHATFLLQQKENIKAVSSRLGHADVKITLGIYTHVMPQDDERLATTINAVL